MSSEVRLSPYGALLSSPSGRSQLGARRFSYQPALDGLRAISVLAVLAYHLDLSWAPGGFLGVEVFFVISGYLITSMLIEEWRGLASIDLLGFWQRRARRLLPALYVVLVAVAVAAITRADDAVSALRTDLPAALAYVTNWRLIFGHQSYFAAAGRPPLLRHLWSLAIEEQFYLVWPVLVTLGLRLVRGRFRKLAVPIALGALASTVLMAVLFHPGHDPSRVYYGTDTRAQGLLLGAAFACVWNPWRWKAMHRSLPVLESIGTAGLGALVLLFARVHDTDEWMYRGGFLLVGVATIATIAPAVHASAGRFRSVLGAAPLRAIGQRSYGLYLWHWPVFMLLRPQDVSLRGTQLTLVRLGVTALVTEASFRLVETPCRQGAIGRLFARWRSGEPAARRLATAFAAAALVLVAALTVRIVRADSGSLALATVTPSPAELASRSTSSTTAVTVAAVGLTATASSSSAAPPPFVPKIAVVGDSVARSLVRSASAATVAHFSLSDHATEGCGLVQGSIRSKARWRVGFDRCGDVAATWAGGVRASGANVALVNVGAWEVFDLTLDGKVSTFGTPEHDAYLRSRRDAVVRALVATGARVALLEVPCMQPISAGGLRALPERGDDARVAKLNELLREAAAADPAHVSFVSTAGDFCSDHAVRTSLRLRWDGVHYDRPGAEHVWAAITPALDRLQAPGT